MVGMAGRDKVGGHVDPAAARAHVEQLLGWGMTNEMISNATARAVSASTVGNLLRDRYVHIQGAVAQALLDVGPQPVSSCPHVLAIGAQRRIRALQRRGWDHQRVDAAAGLPRGSCAQIVNRDIIRHTRWEAIARVYDRLSADPAMGPSDYAARHAIKQRWPAPMDWEVSDIDHPAQHPLRKLTSIAHAIRVEEVGERRARVASLTRIGMTSVEIAEQLGVEARTVVRDRAINRQAGSGVDDRQEAS